MATPFLLVVLAVFVAFLGVLAGLAVAVTKTVNPDGRTARGFFGALGSSLALLFLCGLALFGTGLFGTALAVGTAIESNPIRHIEVRRGDASEDTAPHHDAYVDDVIQAATYRGGDRSGPVHLIFSVEGGAGRELIDFLVEVVGLDRRQLERSMTVQEVLTSRGEVLELYDVTLPCDDDDLADLEREIRRELDGLEVNLPESVVIEFQGAR